jgi:hypothetical protein
VSNGQSNDPVICLGNALDLVFSAIAVAERGRRSNPSVEEDRILNERLNDLRLKQATIEAQLDSIAAGTLVLPGPSPALVAQISFLTGQVEDLTRGATSASAAVAFTGRVLTVATDAIGSHGPGGGSHA